MKSRASILSLLFFFALSLTPSPTVRTKVSASEKVAASISLAVYLEQVRKLHLGYRAALQKFEGASAQVREAELFYGPRLFSNYSFLDDRKPTSSQGFQGDQTKMHSMSLGVHKLSSTGTESRLYYELNHSSLHGTTPSLVAQPKFYQNRPVLELSQPLWRNFFGSETRAMARILESQSLAQSFSERFRMKEILMEAEVRFYTVLFSELALQIRKSGLAQAKELRNWAQRRSSLELADKSDSFQAAAAYQMRQLDLDRGYNDRREAIRAFNSLRGLIGDELSEQIEPPLEADLQNLSIPLRGDRREDTLALEQRAKLEEASAKLTEEKYRPSLDLKGSIAGNGRDPSMTTATTESFQADHPTYSIGIALTMPLYYFAARDVKEGSRKQAQGAQADFQRKAFEEDRAYDSLVQKFANLKRQLKMAVDLERIEKGKVENERSRLRRGRTTTFQVLNFEQDYNAAQLNRILVEAELLASYAQLRTYTKAD